MAFGGSPGFFVDFNLPTSLPAGTYIIIEGYGGDGGTFYGTRYGTTGGPGAFLELDQISKYLFYNDYRRTRRNRH
ncbi:MAG: hypothetical protein GY847_36310 [Proteobacteria bacterium]|nr:hypothetical protein [Pseudomonadota bacterium]